jgi:hypothetical protein
MHCSCCSGIFCCTARFYKAMFKIAKLEVVMVHADNYELWSLNFKVPDATDRYYT